MSTADILTKERLAETDVILNRTNLALARSRKLIESWMSTPKSSDAPSGDDEEEDFNTESETAGLGSTVKSDENGSGIGSFNRSRYGGNEKLLEQILGKKGAKDHLKAKAAARTAQNQTKPIEQHRGLPSRQNQQRKSLDDNDDEEEGRTATIGKSKSKLAKSTVTVAQTRVHHNADDEDEYPSESTCVAAPENTERLSTGKRKATSYLDELLLQKSKKKKKGRTS